MLRGSLLKLFALMGTLFTTTSFRTNRDVSSAVAFMALRWRGAISGDESRDVRGIDHQR